MKYEQSVKEKHGFITIIDATWCSCYKQFGYVKKNSAHRLSSCNFRIFSTFRSFHFFKRAYVCVCVCVCVCVSVSVSVLYLMMLNIHILFSFCET